MVHIRYIKRDGKKFGPYYYESYRENGQVKKKYIGDEEAYQKWLKKSKKNSEKKCRTTWLNSSSLSIFIFLFLILAGIVFLGINSSIDLGEEVSVVPGLFDAQGSKLASVGNLVSSVSDKVSSGMRSVFIGRVVDDSASDLSDSSDSGGSDGGDSDSSDSSSESDSNGEVEVSNSEEVEGGEDEQVVGEGGEEEGGEESVAGSEEEGIIDEGVVVDDGSDSGFDDSGLESDDGFNENETIVDSGDEGEDVESDEDGSEEEVLDGEDEAGEDDGGEIGGGGSGGVVINQTGGIDNETNETKYINETIIDEINQTALNQTEIGLNETLLNETLLNETLLNETLLNETLLNETLIINQTNITIETRQYKAVIGRPVKWTTHVKKSEATKVELEIELPKQASDISVKKGRAVDSVLREAEKYEELIETTNKEKIKTGVITGNVAYDINKQKGIFTRFYEWVGKITFTGRVVGEIDFVDVDEIVVEGGSEKRINLSDVEDDEIIVEYYTEAPYAEEIETENGKRIKIIGPDDVHYENILAYSELDDVVKDDFGVYWSLGGEKKSGESIGIGVSHSGYDLNGDGNIDYVEWIVPHLSTQEYEVVKSVKADVVTSKWGGEVVMNLKAKGINNYLEGEGLMTDNNGNDKLVKFVEREGIEERHEFKQGSLEWDIIWDSVDDVPSIVEFEIEQNENLNWYKQRPLYIEAGLSEPTEICSATQCNESERPVNVVNSYAIYYNKEGNEYETGKFAHLYRPVLIDENGDELWIDQNYEDGVLSIDLSEQYILDWLESAEGSILLDPVFGYDSVGATAHSYLSAGTVLGNGPQTPPSVGDVTHISAYVNSVFAGDRLLGGIYSDKADSQYPVNVLVVFEEINYGTTTGWHTAEINNTYSLELDTEDNYWLAIHTSGRWYTVYDSHETIRTRTNGRFGGPNYDGVTLPDPWSEWGNGHAGRIYSIYVNYTEGSSEDTTSPQIEFDDTTTEEGIQSEDFIFVNVTSSDDGGDHYTFVDFAKDVVLWLRMDDTNSTMGTLGALIYDNSSYGNNGTAKGDAVQTAYGKWGKAYEFDGSGDYIDLGTPSSLSPSQISISAWVKTTSTSAQKVIRNRGYGYEISFGSASNAGKIYGIVYPTTSSISLNSGTTYNDGEWHHVVFTYNASATRLYVDGIEKSNSSGGEGIHYTGNAVAIGRDGDSNGGYFDGSIDDVIIFNRSLSEQEVKALYNATASQYYNNFTNLSTGTYNFTAYAVDLAGNVNSTEERSVEISSGQSGLITIPSELTNAGWTLKLANGTEITNGMTLAFATDIYFYDTNSDLRLMLTSAGAVNLTGISLDYDSERTVVDKSSVIGIDSTKAIFIPNNNNLSAYVCPDADVLDEVIYNCEGAILFSFEELEAGTIKSGVNGSIYGNYYMFDNLAGSGGGEMGIVNYWTCGSADSFSNSACWSNGTPTKDHHIIFNGSGLGDCNISNNTLPQDLYAFHVEPDYTGEIKFNSLFAQGNWTGDNTGTQEWNISNMINISGGQMIVYGDYPYNISVEGHGQIWKSLNSSIFVGSSAVINGTGLGFPTAVGPGYDGSLAAAHGGTGSQKRGKPYGNATAPTSLGSGGYNPNTHGGAGIKLQASSGEIIVNGDIIMDARLTNANRAGAGGSIWLKAGNISGTGLLSAIGGGTTASDETTKGGGGRMRLEYDSNLDYTGEINLRGGIATEEGYYYRGYPGTLTFTDNIIPGDFVVNGTIGLLGGDYGEGEVLNVFGNLTIPSGSLLYVHGDCYDKDSSSSCYNTSVEGQGVWINSSESIIIESGGKIDGEGGGFEKAYGPGYSSLNAAHGGKASNGGTASVYGNASAPTSLGSGGYNEFPGGGAVKLEAVDSILVDGEIKCEAINNPTAESVRMGSGGSIWLKADNISGTGLLSVAGARNCTAACGAGGRMRLEYGSTLEYTGITRVIREDFVTPLDYLWGNPGTLTFSNNIIPSDFVVNGTWGLLGGDYGEGNVTNVLGSLTIPAGSAIFTYSDCYDNDYSVCHNVSSEGAGVWINASGDIIVENGGVIDGTGLGFAYRKGPGYGDLTASHGGYRHLGTGTLYGDAGWPTSIGSGGYTNDHSGGSAIRLESVSNVIVNGTILQQGLDQSSRLGSGGSILLIGESISGIGSMNASGSAGSCTGSCSGGGRIALHGDIDFDGDIANKGGNSSTGGGGSVFVNATSSVLMTGSVIATGYTGGEVNMTDSYFELSGDYNATGTNTNGSININYTNCDSLFTASFDPVVNWLTDCNALPITTTPVIVPLTPYHSEDLNCTFSITDADDDSGFSANVSWYKDGEEMVSYVVSGIEEDVNTGTLLLKGNTSAGENWTCGVTPYDGEDYGVQKNSSEVEILQSNMVGLNPIYPTTDIDVNRYEVFNYTTEVCCLVGDCGDINVSLDPLGGENIALDATASYLTQTYYEGDESYMNDGNPANYFMFDGGEVQLEWETAQTIDSTSFYFAEYYRCGFQDYTIYYWDGDWTELATCTDSSCKQFDEWIDFEFDSVTTTKLKLTMDSWCDSLNEWNATAGTGIKSGLVSTEEGDSPFWTNISNPSIINLNESDCENVTWWVNATGLGNSEHVFFAYANVSSNPEFSNITDTINVTIIDSVAPKLSIISPEATTYDTPVLWFNVSADKDLDSCKYSLNDWATNVTMTKLNNTYFYNSQSLGNDDYVVRFWCNDSGAGNVNDTESVSFSVAAPKINLDMIYPLSNTNVSFNEFFNVTTQICCEGYDCGDVNVSLDPTSTCDVSTETCSGCGSLEGSKYSPGGSWDYTPEEMNWYWTGEPACYDNDYAYTVLGDNDYCGYYLPGAGDCVNYLDMDSYCYELWCPSYERNGAAVVASDCVCGDWCGGRCPSEEDYSLYFDFDDAFFRGNSKSGLIPIEGDWSSEPFYTNKSTNPYTINLNASDCENVTFYVNATGDLDIVHEFFVYANRTSDGNVNNISNFWNVTIIEGEETSIININLENPEDDYLFNYDNTPDFVFNASSSTDGTLSCVLWLDNGSAVAYGGNESVANATSTTITANVSLANGDYDWWINCSDSLVSNISEVRNISINYPENVITECGTLSSDNTEYKMVDNIIDLSATGQCVYITGTNVTLDCQDFYILNNNIKAVYVNGANATIRNCNLSGGSLSSGAYGINSVHSGTTAYNNILHGNYRGFSTGANAHYANFTNNTIYNSSNADGSFGGDNSYLVGNNLSSSASYGFYLTTSDDSVIQDNYFSGQGYIFYISGSHNTNFSGNTLDSCTGTTYCGYRFLNSNNSEISNEVFSNINGNYLYAVGSHNTLVRDMNLSGVGGSYYYFRLNSDMINFTLLNMSYDKDEYLGSGTELFRKWYYRAYVNDSGGEDLEGVSVNAYNVSGSLITGLTTGVDGLTGMSDLIDYVNIDGSKSYYSNYTINASKEGYENSSKSYNVSLEGNNVLDGFVLSVYSDPFSLTECKELNESGVYTLANNISNYEGTCFNITADDVVLNLNGSILDGTNDEVEYYGVYGIGLNNITIKNGTIKEFGDLGFSNSYAGGGIYLSDFNNSVLSDLILTNHFTGAKLYNGYNNNISNIYSSFTEDYALYVGNGGNYIFRDLDLSFSMEIFYLNSVHDSFVYDSRFENGMDGFVASTSNRNFYSNITSTGSDGGMSLGYNNTLENINLDANLFAGLTISGSGNSITNLSADYNSGWGVYISETNNNLTNVNTSNSETGIYFDNGNNFVDGWYSLGNYMYGAAIYSSNNIIQNFEVDDSESAGIYFASSSHNLISNGVITPFIGDAVYLDSSSTNNTLLNVSYDGDSETLYSNSELFRKWYFDAIVNDSEGYLEGANVSGFNISEVVVFSELSSADGGIVQKELIEYMSNGTKVYSTPHIINISKEGYLVNSTEYNLSISQNVLHEVVLVEGAGTINNWNCSTGSTQLFSNSDCWSLGHVPIAEEDAVFNSTGSDSVNITNNTLVQDLNSFSVDSSYTGDINFLPLFAVGNWTGRDDGTQLWNVTNNINISGGTMYIWGDYRLVDFYGVEGNITEDGHGQVWRSLSGNISVGEGAVLDGVGLGFPVGIGPGASTNVPGTHGGIGGENPKPIYGNEKSPRSLGSGGEGTGAGFGGSALKLETEHSMNIDGKISMNGSLSSFRPGAGGSIWLKANNVSGIGVLEVSGGNPSNTDYWGGGGGRLALISVNEIIFSGLIGNLGGTGGASGEPGSGGTVYINATSGITSSMNVSTYGYEGGNITFNDTLIILSGVYNASGSNADAVIWVEYTDCVESDFSSAVFSPNATYWGPCVDTTYPEFYNYEDNNATLLGVGEGVFNVSVNNTNGSVIFEINGINISASNETYGGNIYNVSYDFYSEGVYPYKWYAYGNGSDNLLGSSAEREYSVNATQYASVEDVYNYFSWEISNIEMQVRSCDDDVCDTEGFVGPDGESDEWFNSFTSNIINVSNNNYFQFKTRLFRNKSIGQSFTPRLRNVTISYINDESLEVSEPVISKESFVSGMNCSATGYTSKGDVDVIFKWYVDNNLFKTEVVSTTSGTEVSSYLNSTEVISNRWWNCSVQAYDGNYSDVKTVRDLNFVLDSVSSVYDAFAWENMVRLQVRSCDNSECLGEDFVGPDNTANSWMISSSEGNISNMDINPRRYFQFKANLLRGILGSRVEQRLSNVSIETGLVDGEPPSIEFEDTTSEEGNQTEDWIFVNVSSSDNEGEHYVFNDFNRDLVLWMTFDYVNQSGEGALIYDNSSYGNNGTAYANAVQNSSGKWGSAYEFDGSGDYISTINSLPISGNQNRTFSMWVKVRTYSNDRGVWNYGSTSTHSDFSLELQGTVGGMTINHWFDDLNFNLPGDNYGWHLITATYNGTATSVYINGEYDSSVVVALTTSQSTLKLGVSRNTAYSDVLIDDVLIFNRSLDDNEIQSLYNATASQYYNNYSGLDVGVYNFTAYAVDLAGNVNSTEERSISIIENVAPENPTPEINSTDGSNKTLQDLNCYDVLADADGDDMNVSVIWYRDDIEEVSINYTGGYANASSFNAVLGYGNTTKEDVWKCSMRVSDGIEWSDWVNSSELSIVNSPPSVELISPADQSSSTERKPTFSWTGIDDDGDGMIYEINISLVPAGLCGDSDRTASELDSDSYTLTSELNCFWQNSEHNQYEWRVRANDGDDEGEWSEAWRFNITSSIEINLTQANINFGNLFPGEINDTTNDNPLPFVLENIGNALVNVSINSSALWNTQPTNSDYFRFKIDNKTGEEGAFAWLKSLVSWTQVPITGDVVAIVELNYSDDNDEAEIDIAIEVPLSENPNPKDALVVFKSSLAE